jgi:hypothetical protein
MAQLLILKTEFLDAHAVYENSSDVIFYRRISDSNPELTLAPVNVEHAGRVIGTAANLPPQPSRLGEQNTSLKGTMFLMVKRSSVTKNTNLNQHHPMCGEVIAFAVLADWDRVLGLEYRLVPKFVLILHPTLL